MSHSGDTPSTRTDGIGTLALDLLRAPERVPRTQIEALAPDDWQALIALGNEHRFSPYLAHILATRPQLVVPDGLLAARERSAIRAVQVGRECILIHNILAEAGIAHLFLKGVALAFRDYPHAWMRPMRDIDVLVEPGRLEDAHALLLAEGGSIEAFAHIPVTPKVDGKHLAPIHSPNRILPVEIHYRMISPQVGLTGEALNLLEREVWRAPEAVPVGGANLPVPATELLLAHLIIHGMLDHELNNGPLFMTDIVHLLERNELARDTWDALVQRAGFQRAVELTASILPDESGAGLLAGAMQRGPLSDKLLRSLMFQAPHYRSELKVRAALAETGFGGRMVLLWRKLFVRRVGLQSRWLAENGAAVEPPDNIVALWLWSTFAKVRQLFRGRDEAERSALRNLREFRRQLDR